MNIQRKLYVKQANKGITLHYRSHHPASTKRSVVGNELRRAEQATDEHRAESISMAKTKLLNNGYPRDWLKHWKRPRPNRKPESRPECVLKLPFVTDRFNNHVRHLLKKHGIAARLVNYKGRTLQDLVKIRHKDPEPCKGKSCPAPGICHNSSVVYCATCTICNDFYIGMTARRLHGRGREHLKAARQRSGTSVFGDHYAKVHPDAVPRIGFRIIHHQRNDLRLHIAEALAIKTMKPPLNRRQEDLGTGFLP